MSDVRGFVLALMGAASVGAAELTWEGGLSLSPESAEISTMRRQTGDAFADGGGVPNVACAADGSLDCRWEFAPDAGVSGDIVRLYLDAARYAGGSTTYDGKAVPLPLTHQQGKNIHLFSSAASSLVVCDATGRETLRFAFPGPVAMHSMDNREWGISNFVVRFEKPADGTAANAVAFSLSAPGRTLSVRNRPAHRIRKGAEWVPVDVSEEIADGSALDFSSVVPSPGSIEEANRIVVRNGRFERADRPGERFRFVGCNICNEANLLRGDLAERFAVRLRRLGYNALRLHHHDGGLVAGSADGTTINAGNLALMDGLLAACAHNGIYVTTDLFVSRSVPYRSVGIDKSGTMGMDEFKRLVLVHEGAYSNLCAFARAWLTHVNSETGRRWADEPALALVAFVNEGHLGAEGTGCLRRHPEYVAAWNAWTDPLNAKPATIPDGKVWDKTAEQACVGRFLASLEMKFAARFAAFLREEVGLKALLSDMSAGMEREEFRPVRASAAYDYVDEHFYWDHPSWPKKAWSLPARQTNGNPIRSKGTDVMAGASKVRVNGKPFVATEWDFTGPSVYRQLAGLVCGTEAAKEDWGGVWRFNYASSPWEAIHPPEVKAGFFSLSGDPLALATERATMCLFGRGDFVPEESTVTDDAATGDFAVTTSRTSGGFSESGTVRSGALVAKGTPGPMAIWASSLDGAALSASRRILVTHLTDLQNSGISYADDSRTIILDWGKVPHLMRFCRASVGVTVAPGSWEVWALGADGARKRRLPYSYTPKGRLVFTADVAADPKSATWLYELRKVDEGKGQGL